MVDLLLVSSRLFLKKNFLPANQTLTRTGIDTHTPHLARWGRLSLPSNLLRLPRHTHTSRTDLGSQRTAEENGWSRHEHVGPDGYLVLLSTRWGWNWPCWWHGRWGQLASQGMQSHYPQLWWLEAALQDEGRVLTAATRDFTSQRTPFFFSIASILRH